MRKLLGRISAGRSNSRGAPVSLSSATGSGRIPGPRGWPVLGVLPAMRHDVLGCLRDACRYGDLVRLGNPLFPLYLLNHPDLVAHVLQSNADNYTRSPFHDMLRPVLGNGLLTSDGAFWKRQRQLIQPAFVHSRMQDHAPAMRKAVARLCERWSSAAASREALDIAAEMSRLTAEVIVELLFGDIVDNARASVRDDIGAIQNEFGRRFWSALPPAFCELLPTPANRRYRAALRRLEESIHLLIEAHRKNPRKATLISELTEFRDPLTGRPMDEAQLRDEVMTLFLAGHESTAGALTWFWRLLSQHPEAEARVQSEADASGGICDANALSELSFARGAIQESLRLYPPIWAFSRKAVAADVLGGRRIARGSVLMICAYTLHRHPEVWSNPETFDPDRFLPARSVGRPRYAYVPFGGGPRVCIGSQFAMLEMLVAVLAIAARYRLRPATGAPVVAEALVTLRPRGGMPMIPYPR